jgi:hypothetical protein
MQTTKLAWAVVFLAIAIGASIPGRAGLLLTQEAVENPCDVRFPLLA